ncbi:MAG: DUF2237 domain-containing protein [Verrucomicrobiae bacterium]|nr:DUF2237 domain-containing protein [Verrucomicrobiae bacterium]
MTTSTNVLGGKLIPCCMDPLTGYHRDGFCHTGPGDHGLHVVCVQVNAAFLEFSAEQGNDLSTPREEFGFPGLKPGDRWCLCATRWMEALEENCAPPVILEATHITALEFIDLEDLRKHALDREKP